MAAAVIHALYERERAQVLVDFVSVRGARLAFDDALHVTASLPNGTDRTIADAVRPLLRQHNIHLKHTHALRLAALLSGRAGFHARPATPAFSYIGGEALETKDVASTSELERRLFSDLNALFRRQTGPFVLRVLRQSDRVLFSEYAAEYMPTFVLVLSREQGRAEWDRFVPTMLDRLRHQVEEVRPGFLDGYVCARHGHVDGEKCSDLVALDGFPNLLEDPSLEAGRGTELAVFSGIERLLERPFEDAVVKTSEVIATGEHAFTLQFELVDVEGGIRLQLGEPGEAELNRLLRRYRRLRGHFGADFLRRQTPERHFHPAKPGAPTGRLDMATLDAELARLGRDRAWLAGEIGVPVAALSRQLDLGPLVRACQLLAPSDFNQLVRKPVRTESPYATEALLRPVLNVVDTVRFVYAGNVNPDMKAKIHEICDALFSGVHARNLTRAGALKYEDREPLHEGFWATEGSDFLYRLEKEGLLARMAVEPLFQHHERLEIPAIGRRLVLFIEPSPVAQQRASS